MDRESRLNEFISALNEEIEAANSGANGIKSIFNGLLQGPSFAKWLYKFKIDKPLCLQGEAPAEIRINDKWHHCTLITLEANSLTIGLDKNFGDTISEAHLKIDRAALVKKLLKTFEWLQKNPNQNLGMSEALFNGISKNLIEIDKQPKYSYQNDNPPNQSQAKAIAASFSKSLSVIWGPPGTGKTRTIARAVESHLNEGRRVLLVSHANTAVDGALEDIAEQLSETFYKSGKLIRLGVTEASRLEQKYPLINADTVATIKSEELLKNKECLANKKASLQKKIPDIRALADIINSIERQKKNVEQLTIEIEELEARIRKAQIHIADLHKEQKAKTTILDDLIAISNRDGSVSPAAINDLNEDIKLRTGRIAQSETLATDKITNFKKQNHKLQTERRLYRTLIKRGQDLCHRLNIKPSVAKKKVQMVTDHIYDIDTQIKTIDEKLKSIRENVFNEASLVATTVTKTFTSWSMNDQEFDVLIVDESSMVPLPQLYWAASKATKAVTIVGDFKQLPPIAKAKSRAKYAKKWLKRSIFDVLGIKSINAAYSDSRVALLDTQYRMAPDIAHIPNTLIYGGLLKNAESTKSLLFNDSVGGQNALVTIDTSEVNPRCISIEGNSSSNFYSACCAILLAKELLTKDPDITIGIATPYRTQANEIGNITKDLDSNLASRIQVNTIHSFQGSEASVIIFDCVEGPGSNKFSLLDDQRKGSDAEVLLNVAFTRARQKLFIIANKTHILKTFGTKALLSKILNQCASIGIEIQPEQLPGHFVTSGFEDWDLMSSNSENNGNLFHENNFWTTFEKDLAAAQKSIILVSPYLTINRTSKFIQLFTDIINRNVEFKLVTLPPSSHSQSHMAGNAKEVLQQLTTLGIEIHYLESAHQKVAVIDEKISWEGSLNILSHRNTKEHMRRLEGVNTARVIIANLRLTDSSNQSNGRTAERQKQSLANP